MVEIPCKKGEFRVPNKIIEQLEKEFREIHVLKEIGRAIEWCKMQPPRRRPGRLRAAADALDGPLPAGGRDGHRLYRLQ